MPFPDPPPGRYTSISVGDDHACTLTEDGAAVCWGGNEHGQAEAPQGLYAAISAGSAHTCAVTTGGEIVCWGRELEADPPPGRYNAVSTSGVHACALTEDSEAVCWGVERPWNAFRQTGAPPGRYVATSVGFRFGPGAHPTNSCALTEDGEVVCWGWGTGDYITDGKGGERRSSGPPLRFAGPYTAVASSAGRGFCAVTVGGTAECWWDRPFPAGTLVPFEPTRTPGVPSANDGPVRYTAISASSSHVCALTTEGQAVCGTDVASRNFFGTLTMMNPPDPAHRRYVSIGVGSRHACALTDVGEAVCWDAVDNKLAPPDPPPGRYVAVSDGSYHTCALTEAGEAGCWGWNNFGQAEVPAGRYATISAGEMRTCALTKAGEAICWGRDMGVSPPPGRLAAISVGYQATCALAESGDVACWTSGSASDTPPGEYSAISVGRLTRALDVTGEAVCWSFNSEDWQSPPPGPHSAINVGYGEYSDRPCVLTTTGGLRCWRESGPAWDAPLGRYVAVSGSGERTCALTEEGEALCWSAWGDYREIDTPPGLYTAISSSENRTCGVTGEGAVVCWGDTEYERWPIRGP